MDLTFLRIFVLLGCAALSSCEVSQQKLTGDERDSLSSDTQSTESTLAAAGSVGSAGLSKLSSSASSSSPSPYSFAYNTADVAGTQLVRQEAGDANGAVRGRYGYRDADGLYRTVEYVADANGFRAAIRSNEPGLGNSAEVNGLPASIYLQTEATPSKVVSKVASASSLARQRAAAAAALANATPSTTSTTQRPFIFQTSSTTSRPSILASLVVSSATKGGFDSSNQLSVARAAPVAAARANTVRQQSARAPSTLRLVSSKVFSLPRLAPTTTSTTTTTTTTTEAPATVSQQFLSGQQDTQQNDRSTDDQQSKSDEQIQSDSLGSDQKTQIGQQSPADDDQHVQQVKATQPDQPDQPDQSVQSVQPTQPTPSVQSVQTVQQKQTDQQTDATPAQPEVTFTDNDEAGESLPTAPVQPQIQTPHPHPHPHPAPVPVPPTGPVTHEHPLLVRFLDEDLTYDSLEFPHIQAQPRTIAIQTDDHPHSRLFRIVPIPHHESLRLHQAGANMMYLRSAHAY